MPTRDNLLGKKFHRLLVIQDLKISWKTKALWFCMCDCGNTVTLNTNRLTSGHTKSCGCLSSELTSKRNEEGKKNLLGQKFGRLTVTSELETKKNGSYIWGCTCDCGNYCEVNGSDLRRSGTTSCGCYLKEIARITQKKNFTTHGLFGTKGYGRHMNAKRRAALLQRTPLWADLDAILEFYANCPIGFEVDHRIPLQNKKVSGLHIRENLQYLSIQENRSKNNFFIPVIKKRDSFMY